MQDRLSKLQKRSEEFCLAFTTETVRVGGTGTPTGGDTSKVDQLKDRLSVASAASGGRLGTSSAGAAGKGYKKIKT